MRKAPVEAVIFIGIPGSGKTSFYKERLLQSHVRISLDLLKTRYREQRMLELCLATEQPLVIDNTNPARQDRAAYIELAKSKRFRITGYYFRSRVEECLQRNANRPDNDKVPPVAIYSTAKKLELPSLEEGFDQLFYVRLGEGGLVVEEWRDDL